MENLAKKTEQNTITTRMERPYSLFHAELKGRKMTRAQLMVAGVIYSFSRKENQTCNYSYSRFQRELGLTRSTVATAISSLKKNETITQDRRRAVSAAYRYHKELARENAYITTPLWLYSAKFEVKGSEPRYLSGAEIDVLSLMITHCSNTKGNGSFHGSIRRIAGILNLAYSTVQRSIKSLLYADLIYRSDKGVNGHEISSFTVNQKLIRKFEKKYKKENKPKDNRTEAERAADERCDRERYYSRLQNTREQRVAQFERRLRADEQYAEAERGQRKLTIEIARAEIYDRAKLPDLERQQRGFDRVLKARMAAMNICISDLNPTPKCPFCNDTGERSDHTYCDCWRK